MSRTDEILKQLKEIANDPKKAMDDYKKETGKGAIGIMPLYAPEELVYAYGNLGRKQDDFKGKSISSCLCLLHNAAGYGTSVLRSL